MTHPDGWLRDERLTHQIIKAFYRVYNKLGYGFLEHVYTLAMERELRNLGLAFGREVSVRIFYDGETLTTYRLDFIVEERVVLELKSTRELHPSSHRQLHNCLRATTLEIGLLLHFGPEARFYRLYSANDKTGFTN